METLPIPLETGFIFILILAIIWFLDGLGVIAWIAVIIGFLMVCKSWEINKDFQYEHSGLGPVHGWEYLKRNIWRAQWRRYFWECLKKDLLIRFIAFVVFWFILEFVRRLYEPFLIISKNILWRFPLSILSYYPWALFQQVILNGYFTNRISKFVTSPIKVSLIAGIIFAIVHWPNPVLVPVTFVGGMMSAYFFQRSKNVYTLALLHVFLAVYLLYFFPDAWHRHLTIGPGFDRWEPRN